MRKNNTFRIGNIVTFSHRTYTVDAIDDTKYLLKETFGPGMHVHAFHHEVSPQAITPQILEKIGFSLIENGWQLDKMEYTFTYHNISEPRLVTIFPEKNEDGFPQAYLLRNIIMIHTLQNFIDDITSLKTTD